MRIRVFHQTVYDYDQPAKSLIQALRMTPRSHDGQYVVHWRIEVDVDGRLKPGEDAFGNVTHQLAVDGPIARLTVTVEGEVETHDTTGIVRGTVERFPDEVYRRETQLTVADAGIQALANAVAAEAPDDTLSILHRLMGAVHDRIAWDPRAPQADTAGAALADGKGCAADGAHVMLAAARHIGIAARYVSGYRWRNGGTGDGLQAWIEAMVPGIGWIAFDPVAKLCPVGDHVRVAVGLDQWGAAPVRASRYGGGVETQDTTVTLSARDQQGSQSQS